MSVAFPIDVARVEPSLYQLRSGVGGPQVTLATHWSRENSMRYLISAAGAA